jgi:uncharacterized protein (DUF433 family)
MASLPSNEYVELREGRHYYVSGTRIGLHVLIQEFRRGETPEAILQSYPSMGSLAKVYGVWSAKTTFRHRKPMFANSSQTVSHVWYSKRT